MKKKIISILSVLSCLYAADASANWQYSGNYTRDGFYKDDGARFVMSLRGGASIQNSKIENDVGALTSVYYYSPSTGEVISWLNFELCADGSGVCDDFEVAGQGNVGNIGAADKLSNVSFAAGASIGFTIPNTPQWRLEAGWDHISESEYNAAPLFSGNIGLTGGALSSAHVESGGVTSTMSTDIISIMAFYDFYDGMVKPLHQMIPYVGFGFGYANTVTTMKLTDLYGDLSTAPGLDDFGEYEEIGSTGLTELHFYKSEKKTPNVAGLLALGFSYGIAQSTYLDFGVRLTYLPKIKWALSNEDGTNHRDWFSANGAIYTNIMAGVRFEF